MRENVKIKPKNLITMQKSLEGFDSHESGASTSLPSYAPNPIKVKVGPGANGFQTFSEHYRGQHKDKQHYIDYIEKNRINWTGLRMGIWNKVATVEWELLPEFSAGGASKD